MGFYPPDALIHEASGAGSRSCRPTSTRARCECTVECVEARPVVRIGLGYVSGVARRTRRRSSPRARRGGPFRVARRAGRARRRGPPGARVLAWSGACDALAGGDRTPTALWRLGVARAGDGAAEGTQLALGARAPRGARRCSRSALGAMVADYATTGLTAGAHPLALLREACRAAWPSSRDLERIATARACGSAGLVVARQRPGTANGIVFMLLEDEHGTINLVVPPTALRPRPAGRPHRAAGGRRGPAGAPPGGGGGDQRASVDARSQAGCAARRSRRRSAAPVDGRLAARRRRLPCRRARRHELRPGPAAVAAGARASALGGGERRLARRPFRGPLRVGSATAMLATVAFLAFWVVVGLVLFFIALRGGPAAHARRCSRRAAGAAALRTSLFAVFYSRFGVARARR